MREQIAFFADRNMLPGLHVALLSTIRTLELAPPLQFTIFSDGLSDTHKRELHKTFQSTRSDHTLEIRDFVSTRIFGASSLHGNFTCYGRLLLADLLPAASRCIYLDCDVIAGTSVRELFNYLDGTKTIAADGCGTCESSLDREFYHKAGLAPTDKCFNSGVLAIDLDRWRRLNVREMCLSVSRRFRRMFKSHEQSLLNISLHDDFFAFGSQYNFAIDPSTLTIEDPADKILHFLGSPKPWDFLGKQLHSSYELWVSIFRETAIGANPLSRYRTLSRTLAISRSMYRVWLQRRKQSRDRMV